MSQKTYPGSNEWLIDTCREAGFTPRILQDADREPAVISFVAAGLGVALLPEQMKRLPHRRCDFPSSTTTLDRRVLGGLERQ
jgi:DNA-binding transcriptional LysR family regulator